MSDSTRQSMIGESVARLFADHVNRPLLEKFEAGQWPQALWQLAVDNGLSHALATEDAGGIGATWSEAYPILRGIGYWQVPLPLADTMIASQLLSLAGIVIPDGPVALIEDGHDCALKADANGAGLRLTGRAVRVAWAGTCRWALASLADGRIALLDLRDEKTVRITARLNPAREPSDDVELQGTPCIAHASNPFPALSQPLRTLGAIAGSAMMVGAMEWLLEQSVQYAGDRVQFGRPIGKNQAIVACADAPHAQARDCAATLFSAAVAKIRSGEAATRATSIAHQVHGAIGFTYEHALNFATRRLWAWRETHGSDAWWAARLGEAAIAGRSSGFWPALTDRHFADMRTAPHR